MILALPGKHFDGRSMSLTRVAIGVSLLLLQGWVYGASSTLPIQSSQLNGALEQSVESDPITSAAQSSLESPEATSTDSIAYAETASQAFGTVDLKTGVFKKLGTMSVLLGGMGVKNGKLYGVGYRSGTLYTVNTSNGALTEVGTSSISFSAFGSTTGGGLYGADTSERLYSIDASSGAAILIGPLGLNYAGYWGLSVNSPVLYFSNDTALYTVDTSTGAAKLVGLMGNDVTLGGILFEDNQLWGGQETPAISVATLNPTTGAAKTEAAFTGTGAGIWWAIAPSPVPPVITSTSLKASASAVSSGTSVSFTALVTAAPGTSTPVGEVSFLDGSKTLSTATLNGTGQATYSTSALTAGTHSIEAKYLGASGDKPSISRAVSVLVKGGPATKLSAASVAFGSETVDEKSANKVVTLTNAGTATLTISSIKLSGSQADDFTMTTTCGTTLNPNASCTLSIAFAPKSSGAKSASVSISDNAANSPLSVSLTGTGVGAGAAPVVKLSTSSIAFGDEALRKTSPAKSVTLTNTGTVALKITNIKLAGGQADDFALSNACGSSLAAGAECTLSVTFSPVSTGAKSASISIADNAAGSPQMVGLSGTGT